MAGISDIYNSINSAAPGEPERAGTGASFLSLPDSATDGEYGAVAAKTFKEVFGLDSPDGAMLSENGKALSGKEYHSKLHGIFTKGFESLESEELRAWKLIPEDDRAARLQVARKARGWLGNLAADAGNRGAAIENKYKNSGMEADRAYQAKLSAELGGDEIDLQVSGRNYSPNYAQLTRQSEDELLASHEAKLLAQNWLAQYKAMEPNLSERGKQVVRAGIDGGGIPPEQVADFMALEPKEQEQVSHLVNASRPISEKGWWRDASYSFGGMMKRMGFNIWERLEEGSIDIADWVRPSEDVYSQPGGEFLYHDDRVVLSPVARDELRHSQLLLDAANAHKPYEDYNQVEQAFLGAVTTLPYMAISAVPYVGMAAVMMDQFQNVYDRVLLDGGDPRQAQAMQWASAFA